MTEILTEQPEIADEPTKKRVLILFAHPSSSRSEINTPLFQASREVEHVTCVDLYREYPTYRIDIDQEQKRLIEHDVVVFMFPMFWYSTPAMLKEWQDLVLEYGFAYGSEGTALHGKLFLPVLSAGGKEEAYCTDGYNHFTIRELLQPLEQMANLTGMIYLAPFALFGARTAAEEHRIPKHIETWGKLLKALTEDRVDVELAAAMPKLSHQLSDFVRTGQ